MIEWIDPKLMNKTAVLCAECDREMDHSKTFVGPTNEARTVCWECLMRE